MDDIQEQQDIANEISEAISNPVGFGADVDEDELLAELDELEQVRQVILSVSRRNLLSQRFHNVSLKILVGDNLHSPAPYFLIGGA